MTPDTELSRLFAQVFPEIPKPDPLAALNAYRVGLDGERIVVKRIEPSEIYKPIDPVDADQAVNGICTEGDSNDQ